MPNMFGGDQHDPDYDPVGHEERRKKRSKKSVAGAPALGKLLSKKAVRDTKDVLMGDDLTRNNDGRIAVVAPKDIKMQEITIGRFDDDPKAQGVIRPKDDSWQLVIDAEGYPHLYIRCPLEQEHPDDPASGFLCVEDMFHPEMGIDIPTLMKSSFGGKPTPEEEDAAHAEYLEMMEKTKRPCPR